MRKRIHDWDGLIAELESSGLSRAEFCRRRKLKYQTMSNWISRRSQSAVTSTRVTGDTSRTGRKAGRRRSASASAKGWTSGSASGLANGSARGSASGLANGSARGSASGSANGSASGLASGPANGSANGLASVSANGLGRFVEVPIQLGAATHTYEIVLGAGRSIRVPAAFDADAVARLIKAVESC